MGHCLKTRDEWEKRVDGNLKDKAPERKRQRDFVRLFFIGARIFLGLVFVVASVDKIIHPKAFAEIIYNYQILPGSLINLTAIILPWLELLLGLCHVEQGHELRCREVLRDASRLR